MTNKNYDGLEGDEASDFREDVQEAKKRGKQGFSTHQYKLLEHPESGYVHEAKNGAEISYLESRGWEESDFEDKPVYLDGGSEFDSSGAEEDDEKCTDNANTMNGYSLGCILEDKEDSKNEYARIIDDVIEAYKKGQQGPSTHQSQLFKDPKTGFVVEARNGLEVTKYKENGWKETDGDPYVEEMGPYRDESENDYEDLTDTMEEFEWDVLRGKKDSKDYPRGPVPEGSDVPSINGYPFGCILEDE